MGRPGSIGCIRMRNRDIVELFDLVPPYTRVDIVEYAVEEGAWATLGAEAGPLREQVFVGEQGVPVELEYDEFDEPSLHVLARGPDDRPIGTGRLLPDGHLGRLAVAKAWRGKGVGTALVLRLVEAAGRRGMSQLALHSQTAATGFYRRFGFLPEGPEFLEAGIPHVLMRRALQP
jgi:predicted GNAT family N-acyltransferase